MRATGLFMGFLLGAACSGLSRPGTGELETCPAGSFTCPCLDENQCNPGLACVSGVCVQLADGPGVGDPHPGGSGGDGGGGDPIANHGTGDDPGPGDTTLDSCPEILAAFRTEGEAISSCTEASECGQVLTGTSCGCTRNDVARTDADTTRFYELLNLGNNSGCDMGTMTTCDCPFADGFTCNASGYCGWNFIDWRCPPFLYDADDGCHCGCRAVDPDCVDATIDSCEICDAFVSCSDQACEGNTQIDPTNNAVCL